MKQKSILLTNTNDSLTNIGKDLNNLGIQSEYFQLVDTKKIKPKQKYDLSKFDIFIFISRPAVKFFFEIYKKNISSIKQDSIICAVGKNTAHTILEYKPDKNIICPKLKPCSESLYQELKNINLANKNVAIIKGIGGRVFLENKLLHEQSTVTNIEVYQRFLPKKSSREFNSFFIKKHYSAILITCCTSINNLLSLALENSYDILDKRLVVVSERIKQYASTVGFSNIDIIENTSAGIIKQKLG